MIPDIEDLFISIFSSAGKKDETELAREAMTGLGAYTFEENAKLENSEMENELDESLREMTWVKGSHSDNLSLNIEKPIDIGRSLKKFANENAMVVIKALQEESPQTFNQLIERTKLRSNILNHTLQDMKKDDLIILKDRKYYLTNYSSILLDGLQNIMQVLNGIAGKKLFLPMVKKADRGESERTDSSVQKIN